MIIMMSLPFRPTRYRFVLYRLGHAGLAVLFDRPVYRREVRSPFWPRGIQYRKLNGMARATYGCWRTRNRGTRGSFGRGSYETLAWAPT